MLTGTHDACVSEHGLTTLGLFPGVSGYSAPEITDANWVSQEADVYSFGVLLLELLTRKVPVKKIEFEEGVDLPQWVCSVARRKWTTKVIDVQLLTRQHTDGEEECLVRLLQLGIHCCSEDPNWRPRMYRVVERIKEMIT
jgi:serine/threonine protein kinase